jgi:hypothetical protein
MDKITLKLFVKRTGNSTKVPAFDPVDLISNLGSIACASSGTLVLALAVLHMCPFSVAISLLGYSVVGDAARHCLRGRHDHRR